MKILAGIVLFNPDIERLKQNIASIQPQVDQIICVDNGSDNLASVKEVVSGSVDYIELGRNLGIAAALNRILNYAADRGYDWFITLDHDSVCESGLIDAYKPYIGLPSVAILTCKIVDRNFTANSKVEVKEHPIEIDECITSASFCRTDALMAVDGFDEKMFIDSVDFDICLNLRKHGYKIYRIPFIGLLHEVGHGKNVRLLWKKRIIYNHSPLRNYYIARNHFYMAGKYPEKFSTVKIWLKEIEARLLIRLYEDRKNEKIRARKLGIRDAKDLKMGECKWQL